MTNETKKKGLEARVKELEEWAKLMVEWAKTVTGGVQTESENPPGNPPPFPPR